MDTPGNGGKISTNQGGEEPQIKPAPPSDQQQPAAQPPQGGKPAGAKEGEFVGVKKASEEQVPIMEIKEPGEFPPEVEGWLERVGQDTVPEPETIVHQGKTILSPAAPQDVSVSLPLDEGKIQKGLHQKIFESIRWLAVWCVRLVKKYRGKTDTMQGKS